MEAGDAGSPTTAVARAEVVKVAVIGGEGGGGEGGGGDGGGGNGGGGMAAAVIGGGEGGGGDDLKARSVGAEASDGRSPRRDRGSRRNSGGAMVPWRGCGGSMSRE